MPADVGYRLNPALDQDALARRFADAGRLNIADFLAPEGAARLHALLRASREWRLVVNQGDKVFELDRTAQAALDQAAKASLESAVHAAARYDFQYMFESIRVPDEEEERRARGDALAEFAGFLSSPPVVGLLRRITGREGIDFADAQATAYGLGHFLSAHDDAIEGKNRHAAYVFSLTPAWRPEWGGLLLFHGEDGHIAEAYVPRFNSLTLFAVPQAHSVSMVAPFAAARRYSVTGWLRGRGSVRDG
ncbi:MAG TPA: 2OG-Fe(II) oxygenase family protein [Allosphingosinicella sp.]|nr:2OG-Fe(II) oxygenase family protein [Allosphingosinicella sp.]